MSAADFVNRFGAQPVQRPIKSYLPSSELASSILGKHALPMRKCCPRQAWQSRHGSRTLWVLAMSRNAEYHFTLYICFDSL